MPRTAGRQEGGRAEWRRRAECPHSLRVARGPTIKDANGRLIRTAAAVSLMLRIGNLATDVDFLVCDTLPVPCILGCSFINT